MKYVVIENKEQENELLYDIAEFLWDNGNQVILINNNKNEVDFQHALTSCDCIVLFIYGDYSAESLFKKGEETLHKDWGLEIIPDKIAMLIFSKDGVYTNAIPFPHKLFHLEKLDQTGLARFTGWCSKFNLFAK